MWLAWGGLGIVLASSLALPLVRLPGNNARLRRFQTPEIGRERTFNQTFTLNHDGLSAIEFRIAPLGSHPAGDIDVRLLDITDVRNPRLVRTGAISAEALAGKRSYRFAFAPIASSTFHKYELQILGSAQSGFALVATKGDAYASGTLGVNDRPRWADLIFQTSASPPVGSPWTTLWGSQGESAAERGRVILALLGLNWIAAGLLLSAFYRVTHGSY